MTKYCHCKVGINKYPSIKRKHDDNTVSVKNRSMKVKIDVLSFYFWGAIPSMLSVVRFRKLSNNSITSYIYVTNYKYQKSRSE